MTIIDVSLITQITSGAYGGGVLALCYKQLANGQLNSMEIGRNARKICQVSHFLAILLPLP